MSEELQLPSVATVRTRIESCKDPEIRNCLKTAYLFAGRISEVIGRASRSDHTTARGPKGTDARADMYVLGQVVEPAIIFPVKTAKRKGRVRLVALPANYEPWAKDVQEYFQSRGDETVFPFTRQHVGTRTRELGVFRGLSYPIETYKVKDGEAKKVVARHPRDFALHALRHLRATELVEVFGFDGVKLGTYGGWTYRTGGLPSVLDRYIALGWQSYFPNLLKKRFD